jgi:hypothetical protein
MKALIRIALAAVLPLIWSCENPPDTTQTPSSISTNSPTSSIVPADLTGIWVSEKYIDDLKKFKCLRQAFDSIEPLTVLNIRNGDMIGDTQRVSVSYGGHEGGECFIVFKPYKLATGVTFSEASNEPPYKLHNARDLIIENGRLVIQNYDENGQPTYKSKYIRASILMSSEGESGLDNILEQVSIQTLFKGKWYLTKSNGEKSTVQIDEKGGLTGFGSLKTLGVYTDYVGIDFANDMAYFMEEQSKKPIIIAFKHSGNMVEFWDEKSKTKNVLYKISR